MLLHHLAASSIVADPFEADNPQRRCSRFPETSFELQREDTQIQSNVHSWKSQKRCCRSREISLFLLEKMLMQKEEQEWPSWKLFC